MLRVGFKVEWEKGSLVYLVDLVCLVCLVDLVCGNARNVEWLLGASQIATKVSYYFIKCTLLKRAILLFDQRNAQSKNFIESYPARFRQVSICHGPFIYAYSHFFSQYRGNS